MVGKYSTVMFLKEPFENWKGSKFVSGSSSPDRNQALLLLKECRILAERLDDKKMDIAISSPEDRQALKGFETVWLAGWLSDTDLQKEARLTAAHIAILGYLLAQQQGHATSK